MLRLDHGLYSRPKDFWGMESELMLTPREKSPLPEKFSPEEDRTMTLHQQDSEPNTLPSYSGPSLSLKPFEHTSFVHILSYTNTFQ